MSLKNIALLFIESLFYFNVMNMVEISHLRSNLQKQSNYHLMLYDQLYFMRLGYL